MTQISGQKTVEEAGTPEVLGGVMINGGLLVKALAGNTGAVYLGGDGQGGVDLASGMPLARGESVVFQWVGSLANLMIDVEVSGEGVAWLALDA